MTTPFAVFYGPLSKLFINRQIAFMELGNDHFIFIGSRSCTIIRHVIRKSVFPRTLSLDKGIMRGQIGPEFPSRFVFSLNRPRCPIIFVDTGGRIGTSYFIFYFLNLLADLSPFRQGDVAHSAALVSKM